MNHSTCKYSRSGVLVAVLALFTSAHLGEIAEAAQGAIESSKKPPNVRALSGTFKRTFVKMHSSTRRTVIDFSMIDKRVSFRCTEFDAESRRTLGYRSQDRVLSYWPTCIRLLRDGTLVVAGRSARGATIIEQWHLSNGGVKVVTDPKTGEKDYAVTPPSVRKVETLYDEARTPMDMVCEMIEIRTLEDDAVGMRMLIQFYSTSDVFTLEVGGRELTKTISSPTSQLPLGVFVVNKVFPAQLSSFIDIDQVGYTYVFWTPEYYPWFAIVDSNRDGILDSAHQLVTEADLVALGLLNRENFISGNW